MEEFSKITISDSLVTDLHAIIEEGRKKHLLQQARLRY